MIMAIPEKETASDSEQVWSDLRALRNVDHANQAIRTMHIEMQAMRRKLNFAILVALVSLLAGGGALGLTAFLYQRNGIPPIQIK